MTKNIVNNKNFLELILTTSKEQALALLHTATKEQQLLISEIAHNIFDLPLPKKAKYYVTKKRKLFERIASKKLSRTKKNSLIQKNAKYILLLLWALKPQLSELQ